ncbi:hypothetical protein [Pseudomonas ogarae]|uniref:Fimbrial protein n=1 Tax=Pseudomonas ogarae (strain DSM 112162 / CECT 30235 / F113) TaxID=1114970 RepID=A0ABM6R4T9_PSEO1|nr:hypothetical protein [Pseudomonas ogarae]AUO48494.1 hypothetical protein C1C98_25090 [Pseudomonas ogarae]
MKGTPVVANCVVSTVLFACMPMAHALTRDITAVFRPDPSKPRDNLFINTTPVSGYCQRYPQQCRASGMFSIMLPITVNLSQPIQANHGDPRQGAMFKVPANWRPVQVTHTGTGETEIVEVRWSGIGAQQRLPDGVGNLVGGESNAAVAHRMLWGGAAWDEAPLPCQYSGLGYYSNVTYDFFWKAPVEGVCAKTAHYLIPRMSYYSLDFAYELRTPNPLKMSAGHYTGMLTYSIGPGQDFDLGDVMVANDSALTLNFDLQVDHVLKVEVPPGGNRVELVPQEGWQAWLNSGRKPTRLLRDQRFHISTSSRFKMLLECQHPNGNTCAVSEAGSGHAVPVDVSVTLPDGLTDASGQPVSRRRLLRDGSGTELFQPGVYINRRSGTLHFEVARTSVEAMLDSGAKAYTGNVTVIWDSEV